jgi:hypothetical protein
MNTKYDLNNLIQSRLAMQSTQRALRDHYGITTPTLEYFLSRAFASRIQSFSSFQKRGLFTLLAGPFNWKAAERLIDRKETVV